MKICVWYTWGMTHKKMSKKEVEALQAQIEADQAKPVRANERRLKLSMSFDEAIDKIAKAVKPPKKPRKK
jgi:hypothetical protein